MAALRIRVVRLDRPAVALLSSDRPRCDAGDSFKFEGSNQMTPKIGGLSQFVADDLKGWLFSIAAAVIFVRAFDLFFRTPGALHFNEILDALGHRWRDRQHGCG